MEAHLEVAGLLGTHKRTDRPALVLNAFESVLCANGVSVGFFDFGRSSNFTVVNSFLGMRALLLCVRGLLLGELE